MTAKVQFGAPSGRAIATVHIGGGEALVNNARAALGLSPDCHDSGETFEQELTSMGGPFIPRKLAVRDGRAAAVGKVNWIRVGDKELPRKGFGVFQTPYECEIETDDDVSTEGENIVVSMSLTTRAVSAFNIELSGPPAKDQEPLLDVARKALGLP